MTARGNAEAKANVRENAKAKKKQRKRRGEQRKARGEQRKARGKQQIPHGRSPRTGERVRDDS
jgi:hypothetical protein